MMMTTNSQKLIGDALLTRSRKIHNNNNNNNNNNNKTNKDKEFARRSFEWLLKKCFHYITQQQSVLVRPQSMFAFDSMSMSMSMPFMREEHRWDRHFVGYQVHPSYLDSNIYRSFWHQCTCGDLEAIKRRIELTELESLRFERNCVSVVDQHQQIEYFSVDPFEAAVYYDQLHIVRYLVSIGWDQSRMIENKVIRSEEMRSLLEDKLNLNIEQVPCAYEPRDEQRFEELDIFDFDFDSMCCTMEEVD